MVKKKSNSPRHNGTHLSHRYIRHSGSICSLLPQMNFLGSSASEQTRARVQYISTNVTKRYQTRNKKGCCESKNRKKVYEKGYFLVVFYRLSTTTILPDNGGRACWSSTNRGKNAVRKAKASRQKSTDVLWPPATVARCSR